MGKETGQAREIYRWSISYSDIVLRLKSWGEEDFAKVAEQFERNLASTSGLMDLQCSTHTPRPRDSSDSADFQGRFRNDMASMHGF